MEELKLIGWVSFDSNFPSLKVTGNELNNYLALIRDDIVKNNYKFSGEEHQNSFSGCPLFSDGTCFRASMRCFGGIMSNIWSDIDSINYSYMDFYMSLDDSNLPEELYFDEPEECTNRFGYIIEQDMQMVKQSVDMGMGFFTTDKVLEDLYNIMSKK